VFFVPFVVQDFVVFVVSTFRDIDAVICVNLDTLRYRMDLD